MFIVKKMSKDKIFIQTHPYTLEYDLLKFQQGYPYM